MIMIMEMEELWCHKLELFEKKHENPPLDAASKWSGTCTPLALAQPLSHHHDLPLHKETNK